MSEQQDTGQERTEEPTPRRLQQARDKGQVPRSRELTTMAVLVTGAAGLLLLGAIMVEQMVALTATGFNFGRAAVFDTQAMLQSLQQQLIDAVLLLAPFFALVMLVALLSPMALGGWSFNAASLAPKPEKLNPVTGLGRVFGPQGLMEFAKALAKFVVVASGAAILLWLLADNLLQIAFQSLQQALLQTVSMLAWGFLSLSALLILIAVVDVPFQLWQHHRQLRMTRQEVKDDLKETEGRPEVKSRVRELQRNMSRQRMIDAVPEADVVITNPTHYAVALKYEQQQGAPRVVAKGRDDIAAAIRAAAIEHDVPLVPVPPLARALFESTRLDQQIPAGLYVAVAQVLAYVYQLEAARQGMQVSPEPPRHVSVPPEYL